MNFNALYLLMLLMAPATFSYAQITLSGTVKDEEKNPVAFALVSSESPLFTVQTDESGFFKVSLPAFEVSLLQVRRLGYLPARTLVSSTGRKEITLAIVLNKDVKLLDEVEVKTGAAKRENISTYSFDPAAVKRLPSAFGDFNMILATLPGVVSNNELSSNYSVRGGNFDENLVYVNGIEIYRPFLSGNGRQEGLSFVNPDMTENVEFSSGGWGAKYGDKLSSVLDIRYREPQKLEAAVTAGLLGGSIQVGGPLLNKRITFNAGFRQKSSRYLLNTLPTKGTYLPKFHDFQSYTNFNLGPSYDMTRTKIGVLTAYARNRYSVEPELSETTFGTASGAKKVTVGFDGTEQLQYDTWQTAVKATHRFSAKHVAELTGSAVATYEREYNNLEGGYRLCDVLPDPNGNPITACSGANDIGTYFNYARNTFFSRIFSLRYSGYYYPNSRNDIEWGTKASLEQVEDDLYEYSYTDSAYYITLNRFAGATTALSTHRYSAYVMHRYRPTDRITFTYGGRSGYWTLNEEAWFSPSAAMSVHPNWSRDMVLKFSTGVYRQPPFYRELRNMDGELNKDLKSQSSWHLVLGSDYLFKAWGRDFKLTSELYYKYLWNLVPYDIDNVRVRYYATNNAIAYATGLDMRVSGEFIAGTQSWFSMGIMQTQENIEGDGRGFINRPSDQRLTFGMFLEDHLPNNPSIRMNLNFLFGTGLPFGLPGSEQYRGAFRMPTYRRVDLGLNKMVTMTDKNSRLSNYFNSLWIGLEVLNLLGVNNTFSYIWIKDVTNDRYAVPQTLSTRFVNLKLVVRL